MSDDLRPLTVALLLSLGVHALLLSLTFGGQGFGFPGFGFPWRERRIEATDLSVVLLPAPATAASAMGTSVKEPLRAPGEHPVARGPVPRPSVPPAPTPGRAAEAIVFKAKRTSSAEPTAEARSEPGIAIGTSAEHAPLRTEGSGDATPTPISEQMVLAAERSAAATPVVPAAPSGPSPVVAAEPSGPSPDTVTNAPRHDGDAAQEQIEPVAQPRAAELARLDGSEPEVAPQEVAPQEAQRQEAQRQEAQRQEAQRQEAQRQEAQRQEAQRQEAQRQEAQRQEAQRQEAQRQEAQRQEAQRQEAQRQEAQQQEAQQQEAQRQEAQQQEAQRQEAARRQAARVEAARVEGERQEAARQESVRQEASRVEAEREREARREAVLRAIGRQLDEEADRREAAANAARLPNTRPLSLSTARRYRLWGRSDPNAELIRYAEAWAQRIQFNTAVETVRELAKRPHRAPMVTVAIRSDGSVESVTFDLSSGAPEVDEAIRRIVEGGRPYQGFPPALAREFDVIEIRRTWLFDTGVRLQ